MEEKNKKDINRRDFIKIVGISAATSTAILYGCSSKGTSSSSSASAEGEIPTDKMTYRTSPTTGDRVSLLGYGCMRWPLCFMASVWVEWTPLKDDIWIMECLTF